MNKKDPLADNFNYTDFLSEEKAVSVYHDVFIKEDNLLESLKNENNLVWEKDAFKNHERKTSTEFFAQVSDKELRNKISRLMFKSIPQRRHFEKRFMFSPLGFSDLEILKILPGGDVSPYETNLTLEDLEYFIVFYLNDDYVGGSIFLEDQNKIMYPKKNDMALFSSKGKKVVVDPITDGAQYIIVVGINSADS
jgi:hypothetical protein